jgi:hypothetical protein
MLLGTVAHHNELRCATSCHRHERALQRDPQSQSRKVGTSTELCRRTCQQGRTWGLAPDTDRSSANRTCRRRDQQDIAVTAGLGAAGTANYLSGVSPDVILMVADLLRHAAAGSKAVTCPRHGVLHAAPRLETAEPVGGPVEPWPLPVGRSAHRQVDVTGFAR